MDDPRTHSNKASGLRTLVWPSVVRPFLVRTLRPLILRPSRAEIHKVIACSELPGPIQGLIRHVLRRARLWRKEQLDVARELTGHFTDGLAAGTPVQTLTADFGNPDAAARLIARAKRRMRPWWWKSWRMSVRTVGFLAMASIGLYTVLAMRYFAASPTIAHDFVGEYNAALLAAPESDRAWPIYREAIIELEPLPEALNDCWPIESATDARWTVGLEYLDRNRHVIDLVHKATDKASLGITIGDWSVESTASERTRRHNSTESKLQSPPPPMSMPELSLFGCTQPFLGFARELTRLLRADLTSAIAKADEARAERDVQSLLKLARHVEEQRFVIAALVAQGIDSVTFEGIKAVLAERPDLLSSGQWQAVAHAVAAINEPNEQLAEAFRAERIGFLDFVQRIYSDNGSGDGHLTAEGVARLNAQLYPQGRQPNSPFDVALMPLAAGTGLSRRELIAFYDDMMRRGLAEVQTPLWAQTPADSMLGYYDSTTRGLYNKARNWPAHMLVPVFSHLARNVHIQRAWRDAALIAIAIELYRRGHDSFPSSLAELAPRFLPSLPVDPADGQTMRYRLINGKPVIYSVGADGIDDQGTPPARGNTVAIPGVSTYSAAAAIERTDPQTRQTGYLGDWILYPNLPPPPTAPQAW